LNSDTIVSSELTESVFGLARLGKFLFEYMKVNEKGGRVKRDRGDNDGFLVHLPTPPFCLSEAGRLTMSFNNNELAHIILTWNTFQVKIFTCSLELKNCASPMRNLDRGTSDPDRASLLLHY
jgi:hypothetical protein